MDFKFRSGEDLTTAIDRLLSKTNLRYETVGSKYFIIFDNTKKGTRKAKKIGRKINQINRLEQNNNLQVHRTGGKSH